MQSEINKKLKRVKQILWEDWDPIGVNDVSSASDEYDSYAPQVLKILISGDATSEKIVDYLNQVESGLMGLTPNSDKNREVARKLLKV